MQFIEKGYWNSSPVKNYGSVLYLLPAGNGTLFSGPFIKSLGLKHFIVDGKIVQTPHDQSLRLLYDYEPGSLSASFHNYICPFVELDLQLIATGGENFLLRYTFHNNAFEDKEVKLVLNAVADRKVENKKQIENDIEFTFDLNKREVKPGEGTIDFTFLREWFIKDKKLKATVMFESGDFADVQEVVSTNGDQKVVSDGVEVTSSLSIKSGQSKSYEIHLSFGQCQKGSTNAFEKIWSEFVRSVPHPDFESEEQKLAYFKSWYVLFFNEVKNDNLHWCLTGLGFPSMWVWDTSPFISDAYMNLNPAFVQNLIEVQLQSIKETGMIPLHVIMGLEDKKQEKEEITQMPLIANSAWQVFKETKDLDFARNAYDTLLKNYNWYETSRKPDNDIPLWGIDDKRAPYHYGPESGMDNCPVYQNGPAYSVAINSAKYSFEKAMSNLASVLGLSEVSQKWSTFAKKTQSFMLDNMWDDEDSYFYALTYGLEKIKLKTSDLYPALYLGLLPCDKVALVSEVLNREFLTDYGLTTVSMRESCFNPEYYALGSVWPFMNYMAYRGLVRASCYDLAEKIFQGTIKALNCFPGVFECYNPKAHTLGRLKDGPICIPHMSFCAAGVVSMYLLRERSGLNKKNSKKTIKIDKS